MLQIIFVILALSLSQTLHAQNATEPVGGGTLPLDTTEAADGTLPLRLPGDGTLPLKLSGNAMAAGTRINTSVSITSADRRALPLQQRASLVCQTENADVSKHAASGSVTVSGASYSIKGICYDHRSKNMEIVASKGLAEKSFMIGRLGSPELSAFSGRLIVNGSASTSYQFSIKTQ